MLKRNTSAFPFLRFFQREQKNHKKLKALSERNGFSLSLSSSRQWQRRVNQKKAFRIPTNAEVRVNNLFACYDGHSQTRRPQSHKTAPWLDQQTWQTTQQHQTNYWHQHEGRRAERDNNWKCEQQLLNRSWSCIVITFLFIQCVKAASWQPIIKSKIKLQELDNLSFQLFQSEAQISYFLPF